MRHLKNKKIIVGICGGIAAYKSVQLIRLLRQNEVQVRVVMTKNATEFVTRLSLQVLSGNPVHIDLFDTDQELSMGHIELSRWADAILIAPASANTLAKLAHGLADDLLTTMCLASNVPIVLAPAMNQQMWSAQVTQDNISRLKQLNYHIWGPDKGVQACSEEGYGRLLEATDILQRLVKFWQQDCDAQLQDSAQKHWVITAGPTREAIDPVRYISNHSSGKMGYAIAKAALDKGYRVTLISGPVAIEHPSGVNFIGVETAQQMYQAAIDIQDADVFIACAAVADYRLKEIKQHKIKRKSAQLTLQLVQNPDIVASVAEQSNPPFTVAFAAESQNLLENAELKLSKKKVNMIAANQIGEDMHGDKIGFEVDQNAISLLWFDEKKLLVQYHLKKMTKDNLARQLVEKICENYSRLERKNETTSN